MESAIESAAGKYLVLVTRELPPFPSASASAFVVASASPVSPVSPMGAGVVPGKEYIVGSAGLGSSGTGGARISEEDGRACSCDGGPGASPGGAFSSSDMVSIRILSSVCFGNK